MLNSLLAQNNTLPELGDLLSVISNCTDLSDARFIFYYYEYHLVNEDQAIPERLLDYLMADSNEGIELNYGEIILFSNFIFQSIEGKIDVFLTGGKGKIELEIIDGHLWEVSFDDEELSSCFFKNELIGKFKIE